MFSVLSVAITAYAASGRATLIGEPTPLDNITVNEQAHKAQALDAQPGPVPAPVPVQRYWYDTRVSLTNLGHR